MIIGIDPGLTGAIALVGNTMAIVRDIPVMANGKGNAKVKKCINPIGLKEIINEYMISGVSIAYLERVSSMPGQGVASMFSMGDTFGAIRTACLILGVPLEIITPQSWKKHYNLGADKEIIRTKAIELFPGCELHRKKDHNRAEALLIAKYGLDKQ